MKRAESEKQVLDASASGLRAPKPREENGGATDFEVRSGKKSIGDAKCRPAVVRVSQDPWSPKGKFLDGSCPLEGDYAKEKKTGKAEIAHDWS